MGGAGAASVLLSWVLFVLVARGRGPAAYSDFAVLWSVYFVAAGVLVAVQQEVARSAHDGETFQESEGGRSFRVLPWATVIGIAVGLVLSATAFVWAPAALGSEWPWGIAFLSLGTTALAMYCAIVGLLAREGAWTVVGLLVIAAALSRLVAVPAAYMLPTTVRQPALAAAISSGAYVWLTMLLLRGGRVTMAARAPGDGLIFLRRSFFGMTGIAASTLMVAGLPLLIQVTASNDLDTSAGVLFGAIALTRAPLLIPLTIFNLPLLMFLTRHREKLRYLAVPFVWTTLISAGVSWGAGYLAGPLLLTMVLGDMYQVPSSTVGGLTAAAAMLIAMNLTGLACLAVGARRLYAMGWLAGTLATIGILECPLPLATRTVSGLVVGCCVGIAVHLMGVSMNRRRSSLATGGVHL